MSGKLNNCLSAKLQSINLSLNRLPDSDTTLQNKFPLFTHSRHILLWIHATRRLTRGRGVYSVISHTTLDQTTSSQIETINSTQHVNYHCVSTLKLLFPTYFILTLWSQNLKPSSLSQNVSMTYVESDRNSISVSVPKMT